MHPDFSSKLPATSRQQWPATEFRISAFTSGATPIRRRLRITLLLAIVASLLTVTCGTPASRAETTAKHTPRYTMRYITPSKMIRAGRASAKTKPIWMYMVRTLKTCSSGSPAVIRAYHDKLPRAAKFRYLAVKIVPCPGNKMPFGSRVIVTVRDNAKKQTVKRFSSGTIAEGASAARIAYFRLRRTHKYVRGEGNPRHAVNIQAWAVSFSGAPLTQKRALVDELQIFTIDRPRNLRETPPINSIGQPARCVSMPGGFVDESINQGVGEFFKKPVTRKDLYKATGSFYSSQPNINSAVPITVRINVNPGFTKADGGLHEYAKAINDAISNGQRVMATIGVDPQYHSYATSPATYQTIGTAEGQQAYLEFVKSFTNYFKTLIAEQKIVVQLLNEPDYPAFNSSMSAEQFIGVHTQGVGIVRGIVPNATVIPAGISMTHYEEWLDAEIKAEQQLEQSTAGRENDGYIDVAFHPYWGHMPDVLQLLNRQPDEVKKRLRLWVTESGAQVWADGASKENDFVSELAACSGFKIGAFLHYQVVPGELISTDFKAYVFDVYSGKIRRGTPPDRTSTPEPPAPDGKEITNRGWDSSPGLTVFNNEILARIGK